MKVLLSFLFVCLSIYSYSEASQDSLPAWEISYSPSALLNTFIGVQFGLTRRFNENMGIEFEMARIPKQNQLVGSEIYKEGYRYKLGFRNRLKPSWFFLTTVYIRNTRHYHQEIVAINQQFFREIEYETTKKLKGLTVGFAYVLNFSNSKFSAEWGLNLGAGRYKVRDHGLPESVELFNDDLFEYTAGDYIYPIVGFIIKVRYRLSSIKNS